MPKSGLYAAKKMNPLKIMLDKTEISEDDLHVINYRFRLGFTEHISSYGIYQNDTVLRKSILMTSYNELNGAILISGWRSFYNPLYLTGNTNLMGNVFTGKYGLAPNPSVIFITKIKI